MAKKPKVDRNLEELRNLESKLVVYVGPGVSAAAGLPTREELVEALVEEIEEEELASPKQLRELEELVEDDPSEAFTEIVRLMSPAMFNRAVEHQLDDDDNEVPELAQAIANLGERLRGVLTPNLDHLIERAFEGQLTVYTEPKGDMLAGKNWLLKIHGTLKDRSSWVFTREQQGQALYNNPLHQDVFRSLFFATPILFVGSSLDDPALEAVVDRIRALTQGQPPRHYALLDKAELKGSTKRKLMAGGIMPIAYTSPKECVEILDSLATAEREERPPTRRKPAKARKPLSILFVAANPKGTDPLRLSNEVRLIRQAIERSTHRDYLDLEISMAATVHDLRRALLERSFNVVHISGHGGREGLMLENEQGEIVTVRKKSLARLLAAYAPPDGNLQCVILNACYSMSTGRRAAMDIPFTIAMDGPVGDDGALEFSRGFYDAVGAGKEFDFAFEEGRRCVDLAAPDSTFEPLLLRSEDDEDDD